MLHHNPAGRGLFDCTKKLTLNLASCLLDWNNWEVLAMVLWLLTMKQIRLWFTSLQPLMIQTHIGNYDSLSGDPSSIPVATHSAWQHAGKLLSSSWNGHTATASTGNEGEASLNFLQQIGILLQFLRVKVYTQPQLSRSRSSHDPTPEQPPTSKCPDLVVAERSRGRGRAGADSGLDMNLNYWRAARRYGRGNLWANL